MKSANAHTMERPAAGTVLPWRPGVREKKPRRAAEKRVSSAEVYLSAGKPVELYTFDDDYLRRLRGADPATEAHFVSYFSALLRIKLRSRFLPPQTVDDACQETFLRVLLAVRSGDTIRNPERLGAFVNSVCNNILLEGYRASARAQQVDMDTFDLPDCRTDLERSVLQQEDTRVVAEVLAGMAPRDRDCLRALFLEDRDKDEICRELGVARGYLRVLVHRAKNSFRAHYKARRS
ncbi:MAG TPA: sigma-70 family RNA polymerase sigma factor [Verrucomicrobiae bacterium]|jgi:RNA polymerase sigma-70 factor (ECF subfamily)|nr:sigma-70 family RNA polymerase sigma factor [Verrucomicrobiae bacterium]